VAARPGTDLGATCDEVRTTIELVVAGLRAGRLEEGARRFVEDVALGPGAWELLPPGIRAAMVANARTIVGMVQDPRWDQITVAPDPRTPVLLTDGDTSPAWLPAIVAALLAGEYRHADHVTFHGAGHVPHLTHPGDLAAVIRRVVAGSSPVSTEVGGR
jgi:pimeloyl-ACP methyl ester carboxylesterase